MILQVVFNGLAAAGPIALMALGLSLVFSVQRVFHVAHSVVFSIGAYSVCELTGQLHLPLGLACCLAVVVASAVGLGVQVAVYAPMRRLGASPLSMLLASLGVLVVGQSCISLLFGSGTLSLRSGVSAASYQLLGARATGTQLVTVLVSFATLLSVSALLRWTRAGLLLRAVACDSELATTIGIRRENIILLAFTIASVTATASGVLVAYDTDLSPSMGFEMMILGLTAAVIGGIGRLGGAVLGSVVVSLARHLIGWFAPTHWQDPGVFLILIACLVLLPSGLLAARRREVTI